MYDLCALGRHFDVVFLCVKAYDTRWAAELIKPEPGPPRSPMLIRKFSAGRSFDE
jgi:ketopantoate reductase